MNWIIYSRKALILKKFTGFIITTSHHCGGETFQSIFSLFGWKYSEKSLLHSDDWLLFRTLSLLLTRSIYRSHFPDILLVWLSSLRFMGWVLFLSNAWGNPILEQTRNGRLFSEGSNQEPRMTPCVSIIFSFKVEDYNRKYMSQKLFSVVTKEHQNQSWACACH